MYCNIKIECDTFPASLINDETGEQLDINVLPPNVGMVKKMSEIDTNSVDNLIDIVSKILSKNKENKLVSAEFVENSLNVNELIVLFTDYSEFIVKLQNNPN